MLQARIQQCEQIDVIATASATTFYGIPDPVTNARVVNNTGSASGCILEWEHETADRSLLSYKVGVFEN